jgi:ribonuclease HI
MVVTVYAKAAVDLSEKTGAYAYMLSTEGEEDKKARPFKKKVNTWASADCSAFLNALYFLSRYVAKDHVTEIIIVTDSGKVVDLLETFKYEKGCEGMATYWHELKAKFKSLEKMTFVKIKSGYSGNRNGTILINLNAMAKAELHKVKELVK